MTDLTDDEAKWIKKLNALLKKCPSDRLGFYTVGDACVEVYDKTFDKQIDDAMWNSNKDFGPTVRSFDAHLATLRFPSLVASTSG